MSFNPNLPANNSPIIALELRNQFNGLKTLVDDAAPVGCLKAWLKNFPGVPALSVSWAECNGQVLNDAQSPLNGQTLPDLNGATGPQRFLRGASVSGGMGGADTMNLGGEVAVDNNLDGSSATVASAPQPDLPLLPSYYEAVWVMRVK
jgi:hypothetical protein